MTNKEVQIASHRAGADPLSIDEYSGSFREEGLERRYTFFGIKR